MMADSIVIPQVYIKEEPIAQDCMDSDFECDSSYVQASNQFEEQSGNCRGISNSLSDVVSQAQLNLQNDNQEDIINRIVSPNPTENSEDNFIEECDKDPLHSDSNDTSATTSNESSIDQSNLHLLIPEVQIKSESYDNDSSDGELSFSDDDYRSSKLNKRPARTAKSKAIKILAEDEEEEFYPRERTLQLVEQESVQLSCPLCGKTFYTSKGLNSHVVKRHNTTLGPNFVCHVCGASGGSRSSLKRHLRRTHKQTIFEQPELLTKKCSHCNTGFASHADLYEHLQEAHLDELPNYHHCPCCPALIKAKASFIRHLKRSHPGQEEPYLTSESCSLCDKKFPNRQAVQRHIKQQHPDICYNCDECNASFKHNYLLSRHKLTHTETHALKKVKKRYKVICDICGRTYDSKTRLEKHMQNIHINPLPQPPKIYPCRICSNISYSAKQNRRHYRGVHLKERLKVHCAKCNITFKTAEECAQHRVLHPNTCDICQKQFLRRDSLREHLMIHADPRHQCPHCPKKFVQSSNLKRHIRVHTGEKPYQCPYCSRRFSDKSACNSHIRVHTGAERSACEICGASFSKKQRLNYHMKIHTGKGLILCPICSRPHTNSYPLRKHVQSHCQPLTNALLVLGLKTLVENDSNLVMDSLNLLTEEALLNSNPENGKNLSCVKLEDPPESEDISDELKQVGTPQSAHGEECDDLTKAEDCSIANPNKSKLPSFEDDLQSKPPCEKYKAPQELSKLLKEVFRVQQYYSKSEQREANKLNGPIYIPASTNPPANDELPNTFADELVKQCLEIVMKAEPKDYEEESDDADVTFDSFNSDHIEGIESEHNSTFSDLENEGDVHKIIDPLYLPLEQVQEIPKLKISRKIKSDSTGDSDFVAEFI